MLIQASASNLIDLNIHLYVSLLDDISTFVQNETATEFMKSLTKTDDRIAQIAAYYRRLDASVASFQVRDALNIGFADAMSRFHSQITSLVNIYASRTGMRATDASSRR